MNTKQYFQSKAIGYFLLASGIMSFGIAYVWWVYVYQVYLSDIYLWPMYLIIVEGLALVVWSIMVIKNSQPALELSPLGIKSNQKRNKHLGVIPWDKINNIDLRIVDPTTRNVHYASLTLDKGFYHARNIENKEKQLWSTKRYFTGPGVTINISVFDVDRQEVYQEILNYWNQYK